MSKEKAPAYKHPNVSCYWDAFESMMWARINTDTWEEWGVICESIMIALMEGNFQYAEQFPFITRIKPGSPKRRCIPAEVRRRILSAGKCAFCGSTERLSVDHIHPVSKGGSNDEANLQCLCMDCNVHKSARVM